jgi:cardiolipin synthase C
MTRVIRSQPDHPRTVSTAFEDPASTRLGQFFGPAADEYPGLSGFSLLSQGREAFIVRLALADLAERSLDMQYYSWDGDTTAACTTSWWLLTMRRQSSAGAILVTSTME